MEVGVVLPEKLMSLILYPFTPTLSVMCDRVSRLFVPEVIMPQSWLSPRMMPSTPVLGSVTVDTVDR